MTENEKLQKAIKEEKELYEITKDRYKKLGIESCKDRAEEHELNIKWPEEIQKYRAIGTIEELQELKENNKFLEFLYDRILPNEMEQYLSMYNATDIKGNIET